METKPARAPLLCGCTEEKLCADHAATANTATARPWRASQQFKNVWQVFSEEICVANCHTTFRGVGVGNQDEITKANAELIVTAVNAYSADREAIKALTDALVLCAIPYEALLMDAGSKKWIAPVIWSDMEQAVIAARACTK